MWGERTFSGVPDKDASGIQLDESDKVAHDIIPNTNSNYGLNQNTSEYVWEANLTDPHRSPCHLNAKNGI